MSTLAGAGAIWQFGFSGSAPLLMATPGNFLEQQAGIMPLRSTIWSPAAIVLVITFTIAVIVDMGNLITPFWAVVGAGIARVDFRLMFGYRLIFAALLFLMGVLAFTFLPC